MNNHTVSKQAAQSPNRSDIANVSEATACAGACHACAHSAVPHRSICRRPPDHQTGCESLGPVETGSVHKALQDYPDVLRIDELATILRISRATAYEHARRNLLPVPVIRSGRRMMVSKAALLQAMGIRC